MKVVNRNDYLNSKKFDIAVESKNEREEKTENSDNSQNRIKKDKPVIYGHTKIVLKNVETGEEEITEEHNLITNGLSHLLKPRGIGMTNISKDLLPIYDKVIGGMLIYQDPINGDENTLYAPSSNKQIARGSKIVTGANQDLEMGLYDAINSGIQENGDIKYTFDFLPTKANGTINAICLTTAHGAMIGDGQSESSLTEYITSSNLKKSSYDYIMPANWNRTIQKPNKNDIFFIDGKNNLAYGIIRDNVIKNSENPDVYMTTTNTLKIRQYKISMNGIADIKQTGIVEEGEYQDIEIFLPSAIQTAIAGHTSQIYFAINASDEGYVYFITAANTNIARNILHINKGQTYYVLRIKMVPEDLETDILTYTAIDSQPSDWLTNYSNYYTRSGSSGNYTYTNITGDEAPTFANNTYYNVNHEGQFDTKLYTLTNNSTNDEMIMLKFYDYIGWSSLGDDSYTGTNKGLTQSKILAYKGNVYYITGEEAKKMYSSSGILEIDDRKVYKQNLLTGTVSEITIPETSSTKGMCMHMGINGKVIFGGAYPMDSGTTREGAMTSNICEDTFIYNPELNICRYSNITRYSLLSAYNNNIDAGHAICVPIYGVDGLFYTWYCTSDNCCYKFMPNILFTINNLENEVTKSNLQTMHIEYTLSFNTDSDSDTLTDNSDDTDTV